MICVYLGLSLDKPYLLLVALIRIKLSQEAGDVLALKPAVAPGADAICPYQAAVAPAPYRITVNVEQAGYFPDGQ